MIIIRGDNMRERISKEISNKEIEAITFRQIKQLTMESIEARRLNTFNKQFSGCVGVMI